MRLTFAARIGLIVLLSLTVAWIGSIALFYLSRTRDGNSTRPLPNQVAALVVLLERTPPSQRSLILSAVGSAAFSARVEPGLSVGTTPRQLVSRVTARQLKNYLDAIGSRPMSAALSEEREVPRRADRISFITPADLELRVGLNTGETLIIHTRTRLLSNVLGLPIGFVAGLLGALSGLVALILMHRETKPLARLSAAVDRIDLAGAPAFIPEARSSAPEIQALIAAFNRLQGRLSQLLRARMAMLGGISHDVRTFATRLRLRVERIPEGPDRERAINDIADMIRLLDDALLASRAGAGELAEELVEFDEIARTETEDRRTEGFRVDIRVQLAAAHASVLGDRLALRRVISNLIDNALQYGRVAHVALSSDESHVLLTVDDEGPGIPPDQRETVLEPFVRLETSRNRRTGGAGLGLAVTRSLVEAHHGIIEISDAPAGGARISVSLPLFRT